MHQLASEKCFRYIIDNNFELNFIKKISSADPDSVLVAEYKKSGNMEVLGELYQRYMDLVYGVCLKYMREPEEAKDCVLSIFEELVSKVKKYPIDHFKAWLYQLAKNHCLMKLRKQKTIPVNIDLEDVHLSNHAHLMFDFDKEDNFKHMEQCLSQLAFSQKQVIELFYLQNKCYKEIAQTIGIDGNMVRSLLQNGRRNLKICMEKKSI